MVITPAPTPQQNVGDTSCTPFNVTVKTDAWPGDTWWVLSKNGNKVDSLANETLQGRDTEYHFDWCLEEGSYKFTLGDHSKWKDGLCCEGGNGYWHVDLGGARIAGQDGDQSWAIQEVDFNVGGAGEGPAPAPSEGPPCKLFKVKIKTDAYPEDTWWVLEKSGSELFSLGSNSLTKRNHEYVYEYCLEDGEYVFTLGDSEVFKDGVCCSFGKGYFIGELGGNKIFGKSDAYPFAVEKFPFIVDQENNFS
jgi:hypothetical protein